MAVYVIAHVCVRDPARFREYQRAAMPTISAAGGRVLAAGRAVKLEGQPMPNHNVIIEFPTQEMAEAWYSSEGYEAAIPVRRESSADGAIGVVAGLR